MKRKPITHPTPEPGAQTDEPVREPAQEFIPADEKKFLPPRDVMYDDKYDPPDFPDDELDFDNQHHRDKYTNDMPQDAAEYAARGFYLEGEAIPTLQGLARLLRVTTVTMQRWSERHKPFAEALAYLKDEQARRLINLGLTGVYHPAMARTLLSAMHGVSEKTDLTSSDGTMTPTAIERTIVHPKPQQLEDNSE